MYFEAFLDHLFWQQFEPFTGSRSRGFGTLNHVLSLKEPLDYGLSGNMSLNRYATISAECTALTDLVPRPLPDVFGLKAS